MTISIIGAGIGGLTTAIALQQIGFDVKVYEQAETLKPVGAGIILANNAMQVYKELGLKTQIEQSGNSVSAINITKSNLEVLSSIDLKYFETKHNCKNIAIHRAKLQEILLSNLKPDTLQLGFKRDSIKYTNDESILSFSNGEQIKSSITIGADGLNSKVRNEIFSDTSIRDAAQICWRGVVDYSLPPNNQNELNEAWGSGDRFGFVALADNKVYWYALKSIDKSLTDSKEEGIANSFRNYNPVVQSIIEQTPADTIHTARISDLKPIKNWSKANICLIGDAAHATTPNLGQGACQAI